MKRSNLSDSLISRTVLVHHGLGLGALLLVGGTVLIPTDALAQVGRINAYQVEFIDRPTGRAKATASNINELGQVVGSTKDSLGGTRSFLWLPDPAYGYSAGLNLLPTIPHDPEATYLPGSTSINDLGQVTGHCDPTPPELWDPHATLWLPEPAYGLKAGINDLGVMNDAEADSLGSATAHDINNAGQVTGGTTTGFRGPYREYNAYIWAAGEWTDLGSLGGPATGKRINELGQVAGESALDPFEPGSLEQHAFIWLPKPAYGLEDSVCINLGVGNFGGSQVTVRDSNGALQVVGYAQDAESLEHAFFWQPPRAGDPLAPLRPLPELYGGRSRANGINKRGVICGFNDDEEGTRHALLWLDPETPPMELDGLTPNRDRDGSRLGGMLNINDGGQICGSARRRGDPNNWAVALSPVTEGMTTVTWDFPDSIGLGEVLSFQANAINNENASRLFDDATLVVSGPLDHRRTLYAGGGISVAGRDLLSAEVSLPVPSGVPTGEYAVEVVLSRDGAELSRDGFDVTVIGAE